MRCDALVPRATAKRATARARIVAAQRSALDDTPRHRFESRNAVVVDASSFSQRRPAALPDTRAIWSQRHVLEAGTTPYACQLCWAAFLLRTWGPRLPVFLSRCLPGTVVPLLSSPPSGNKLLSKPYNIITGLDTHLNSHLALLDWHLEPLSGNTPITAMVTPKSSKIDNPNPNLLGS